MSTTIKTAISIDKSLFEEAESLAKEMNISRSRFFVLAVENFIKRHQSQSLLDEINKAYADEPDLSEQKRLSMMVKTHRKVVEGEW